MPRFISIKTVVRCADIAASRHFYQSILGLQLVEEWDEPEGCGAVFAFGPDGSGSLEIYQMNRADSRFDAAFTQPVVNDKIDVQLRGESVDAWVQRLQGSWVFVGPETLPWGQRWIKLRDPDGLLIAIYEPSPPG